MSLQEIIIERIGREGPLTFAEYMRMALYEPGVGYYVSGEAKMGWEGDYYTSSTVSPVFARCMGRQLRAMWEELRRPKPFRVLEQGAGRGDMARGLRAWAEEADGEFAGALEYAMTDIALGQDALGGTVSTSSPSSMNEQVRGITIGSDPLEVAGSTAFSSFTNERVRKSSVGSDSLEEGGRISRAVEGFAPAVIVSNELLDALPVHIVEKRGERLLEVYVGVEDGRLVEMLGEPSSEEVAQYLDRYKVGWRGFEDGWRAEVNLDALRWMERTAQVLLGPVGKRRRRGFVVTIDYGDRAQKLYTQERPRGTLACYWRHRLTERPLVRPGEQDITAHVDFSALIDEGRRQGLRLGGFMTQREWLEEMKIYEELEEIRRRDFAILDSDRGSDRGQMALLQWYNLRQGAMSLMERGGMGDFKVLILKR